MSQGPEQANEESSMSAIRPPGTGLSPRQSAPDGADGAREGRGTHSDSGARTANPGPLPDAGLPLEDWTEVTLDCQVDAVGHSPAHPDLSRVRIALPPSTAPVSGWCPSCGRGDVAPSGEALAQAQRDADRLRAVLREVLAAFRPVWPSPDQAERRQATVTLADYGRWRTALEHLVGPNEPGDVDADGAAR